MKKPDGLSGKELELYLMIASAFCMQFILHCAGEAQKTGLEIGGKRFEATGRKILDSGWTIIDQDEG